MTEQRSTIDTTSSEPGAPLRSEHEVPALAVAWSRDEPHRIGEVILFEMEGVAYIFGRGEAALSESGRALLRRQRPGRVMISPPIASPSISRQQLRITSLSGSLHVERTGRCTMFASGKSVDRCSLVPGDTLLLKDQLLLLCASRPSVLSKLREFPADKIGDFGEPDAFGILGESPAIWKLRDTIAFLAQAGAHTLILGESGAGKELCARALHLLSPRAEASFVSRNAATLPPGLVDAELFGNAKNYPNPGMPERLGLVGAADGGTLFLDEIGELPATIHANLLRVLDEYGEYHRLGETRARRSDLRLVAATNREPEALKHDLLARLPLRLHVPGLAERREDIPLLIRHLLRRAQTKNGALLSRFVNESGTVRVSAALVEHLLSRSYTTHVRELDSLLWQAMTESTGGVVDLPERMAASLQRPAPESGREIDRDALMAAISASDGNLTRAAQVLGLSSRFVIYRLLRKYGIDPGSVREEGK